MVCVKNTLFCGVKLQMVCRDLGGHLVEIETAAEENFLSTETVRRGVPYWIGASDLLIENDWQWMTSHSSLSYTAWSPEQPTNYGGNENCAEIRPSDGKWNDDQCDRSINYICERSNEVEVIE
ncbi:perlucin-like isoform X3 [Dreissena polymorpha]|uniref:perlucin-like isoform X3 n=1 Tax=Dreissena polymorpha TaxID=45954 RepID=UPI0022656877|nr:perlucin-like isoform X3 [Dreissena polymorpha]